MQEVEAHVLYNYHNCEKIQYEGIKKRSLRFNTQTDFEFAKFSAEHYLSSSVTGKLIKIFNDELLMMND